MPHDTVEPRTSAWSRRLCGVLVAIVALASTQSSAQDQINRPTPDPNTFIRLPVPTPVSARQLPDGRIEVRWAAVEGAAKYDLWRSVPPTPQTVVTRSNPADTTYIDSDVKAGSTYYYVVAAVTGGGISGLRAGSVPVTATTTPTATLRTSDPVTDATDSTRGSLAAPALAQKCVQSGAYSSCVTDLVDYSPVIEPAKNVTATCPMGGQVATGGGFVGNLLNMSVVQSMPVLPDAKTRAGWTVTVTPIRLPNTDSAEVLLELLGTVRRTLQVWVVCAAAGTAPTP